MSPADSLGGNVPAGPSIQRRALPIPTFHLSRSIEDIPTDLLIQTYDDRILVVVTQNKKIGCITQASLPSSIPILPPSRLDPSASTASVRPSHPSLTILPHLPPPSPSTSLLPILGSSSTPDGQTLNDIYVTQIAALIWWLIEVEKAASRGVSGIMDGGEERKAVVVGLTLKPGKKASNGDELEEDDEDIGDSGMDLKERIRFAGVMGMIAEWDIGSGGANGRGDA